MLLGAYCQLFILHVYYYLTSNLHQIEEVLQTDIRISDNSTVTARRV